jgi:sulfite exporter TauE/SafE
MWSAFLLGLLGSLHCAAMCGPFMLGLGAKGYSLFNLLVHHLGRWIGYIGLALLFRLVVSPLYVFELQQYVSFISGVLLVLFGLKEYIPFIQKFFLKITHSLSNKMSNQNTGRTGSLMLGVLNGLLPCGLSFGAAILSVNTATAWQSSLYMVLFGLGTLPMLLAISYMPKFGKQGFIRKLNLWTPMIIVVMGFLLILRSAGLGIPYLSPTYNADKQKAACCVKD